MAETTGIAWCDSTFNPWLGCTKVGPGCDHCYAEAQDSRKRWGGTVHWGAGVPRMRTSAANWKQPLSWNKKAAESGKPWRVFCASLADVFDNEVPAEWRGDLWRLIRATPALTWLLLTKRIGNVAKMHPGGDYPNVWLGATVVNQEEADRDIPKLLATPARVRFVSYEPALGPIDFAHDFGNYDAWDYLRGERVCADAPDAAGIGGGVWLEKTRRIDWVIVGGESGPNARPFYLDWARSTIAQCGSAGVSVFVKQLGSYALDLKHDADGRRTEKFETLDRAGADPAEWPEDLRVREFPLYD